MPLLAFLSRCFFPRPLLPESSEALSLRRSRRETGDSRPTAAAKRDSQGGSLVSTLLRLTLTSIRSLFSSQKLRTAFPQNVLHRAQEDRQGARRRAERVRADGGAGKERERIRRERTKRQKDFGEMIARAAGCRRLRSGRSLFFTPFPSSTPQKKKLHTGPLRPRGHQRRAQARPPRPLHLRRHRGRRRGAQGGGAARALPPAALVPQGAAAARPRA